MDMTTKERLYASRVTEKAPAALYRLATWEGTLADRLIYAWEDLEIVSGRALPDGFRERFEQMHELVTAVDASPDAGRIENSIRALSADQAEGLARQMVDFALAVNVTLEKYPQ